MRVARVGMLALCFLALAIGAWLGGARADSIYITGGIDTGSSSGVQSVTIFDGASYTAGPALRTARSYHCGATSDDGAWLDALL